jgi:alginate O-acetyltransferase complex protein AlgI
VLFNSASFLASFAALVLVYYLIPHGVRWTLLLVASLAFYSTFNVRDVPLLLGITLVAYGAGLGIRRADDARARKALLAAAVSFVAGTLCFFKYAGASGASVGLSFYALSCISYLADVHARRMEPERHLGYFTVYVSFFPKLLAGPIERARPFLAQLRRPIVFNSDGVTRGLQLLLWGLFKKVVIADRLAVFVSGAYDQTSFASPADLLIATYFFAFQLYCDFSGYSDMAIGASKVLGFDLMENFRRPYLSTSVSEFWARRWHISLASWFRDYVYIPLGGNRVTRPRQALNIMTVFVLSGLWHGVAWTFLIWGALNGIYVAASMLARGRLRPQRLHDPAGGALRRFATFHLILVTWVFFRAATIADATTILSRIGTSLGRMPALLAARLGTAEILISLLLIAALIAVEWLDEKRPVWDRLAARPVPVRWAAYYAIVVCLVVLGAWNQQQFVYMQF